MRGGYEEEATEPVPEEEGRRQGGIERLPGLHDRLHEPIREVGTDHALLVLALPHRVALKRVHEARNGNVPRAPHEAVVAGRAEPEEVALQHLVLHGREDLRDDLTPRPIHVLCDRAGPDQSANWTHV